MFNKNFGVTTEKFIELNTDNARQEQFDLSLENIKKDEGFDNQKLLTLVDCFVDIANADDFIHDNEVVLIQRAVNAWGLDIKVEKPKSGDKLKVKSN